MHTITQSPQLYQAGATTINAQVRWAGRGFRAAPAPPPGLSQPTAFYWPRTVDLFESQSGGRVTIGDSGWIKGDFGALLFNAQDKGVGAPLTDYWNIWIADDDDDMLIAPGSSFTAGLVYDPTSGLYTSADAQSFTPPKPVLILDSIGAPPQSTGPVTLVSPYDKLFGTITITATTAIAGGVEVDFIVNGKTLKMFGPAIAGAGVYVYTFGWGPGATGTFIIPGTPPASSQVIVPAQAGVSVAEVISYKDY